MAEITRHVEIEAGYNIRDLGGYPTRDGHQTRWRVLIRAGSLEQLTPVGQNQLASYGVKTVIDLRDEWEAENYPDAVAQSTAMTYRNLPMIGNDLYKSEIWKAATASYSTLEQLYAKFLDHCQPQIGAIITAVAESTPATVFHCFVGKDRTGLVAALLLSLVGVSDEMIAQDYALTSQRIVSQLAIWRATALREGQDMLQFDRDFACEAQAMSATLDDLETRYEGAANYLRLCGVTDQHLARLQTLLIG